MPGYLVDRSPCYLSELLHDGTYFSYFIILAAFSHLLPTLRPASFPQNFSAFPATLAFVYSDGYWTVERARDGAGCLTELVITQLEQLRSMKTLSNSMSR